MLVTRSPLGALGWFAVERLRGHGAEMPTLTAFFATGAVPLPDTATLVLAAPAAPPPAEGLPEPWRSAAIVVLSPSDETLAAIDASYASSPVPEDALEDAAIGRDLRERAVARARASGDAEPESYAVHRRYLPNNAQREADRVVGGTAALATALDLAWPIAVPHRVASGFGERIHPILKTRKLHNGVDLPVPVGTPVLAAQAARVTVVGEDGLNGRFAVLDHGYGIRTSYCHLDGVDVARDAALDRGQVFARSGNTGRSTGPHLHYTLKIGGRAVDPLRFRR
ncbi:MAG: M23 family metallopeptidase [Deltaproteobacteria bacterium]|nr:M23 family metallopeptidase [Deltaproteobacteria bacterium]